MMNLINAIDKLVKNGGYINFNGTATFQDDEEMEYESTIELVQGNKVDVTLKYEDGSEYEECFDYDGNLDNLIDNINDWMTCTDDVYQYPANVDFYCDNIENANYHTND